MRTVIENIRSHLDLLSLNEHRFYVEFRRSPLRKDDLKKFCQEYYLYIRTFPKILAGLSGRVDSEDVRVQLAKIVVSELGGGHGLAHFKLFERVVDAAGIELDDYTTYDYNPETTALVRGLEKIFLEDSPIAAVGGHYTIEETGLPMLNNLYEGFRNYPGIDVRAMEYFHLHLFLEADHVDWIATAVEKLADDDGHKDLLVQGGEQVAELLNNFWNGVRSTL
ncbi:hypothetical protein A1351_23395, partial [Methylosinus sp. R-45379]|uniref:TenA family transcriptional regulator n=1 Tax=Methylosinus sp. R-45379 TaxID=980563 RepID=UPI0007D775FE